MLKAHPDFLAKVYQARVSYGHAMERGSKSTKREGMVVQETYKQAIALGFRGQLREWQMVLSATAPRALDR